MGKSGVKRQSRNEARYFRTAVMARAMGTCQVCELNCPWIGEVHHIKAVASGGDGWPTNLIFLCPNCHAVIEKIRTRLADNPAFEQWVYEIYGLEKGQQLIDVAYEVAA